MIALSHLFISSYQNACCSFSLAPRNAKSPLPSSVRGSPAYPVFAQDPIGSNTLKFSRPRLIVLTDADSVAASDLRPEDEASARFL